MKTRALFLLTFLLNCFIGLSQEVTIEVKNDQIVFPKNGVYMLDSAAAVRRPYQFALDRKDGFAQVSDDYFTLRYMFRGKTTTLSGKMSNKKIVNFEGIEIHAFTVTLDNKYSGTKAGNRVFYGISYDSGQPVVYQLDVYRIPVTVFSSHMASDEEVKLLKYLK